MAQFTTSTTLRNSTMLPSPVRLTTRPWWTAMVGSIRSLRSDRSRARIRSRRLRQAANSRRHRTPRSRPVFASRPRRYAAATVSAVSGRPGKASGGHRKDARGMSIIGLGMAVLPCCVEEDVEQGARPCVSTGRSIHAVPSISPSLREGVDDGPRPPFAESPQRLRCRFASPITSCPSVITHRALCRRSRSHCWSFWVIVFHYSVPRIVSAGSNFGGGVRLVLEGQILGVPARFGSVYFFFRLGEVSLKVHLTTPSISSLQITPPF